MARKIDIAAAPAVVGTLYPPPFDEPCRRRRRVRLGDAAGLTQCGVNLMTLPPGAWSSQRHWHRHEDEFVYVVSGRVVLVTDAGEEVLDAGEEVLDAGDCAGFRAGDGDGHTLQNRFDIDAVVLEVGTRHPGGDGVVYSDIDMVIEEGEPVYRHRDGTPYPARQRQT